MRLIVLVLGLAWTSAALKVAVRQLSILQDDDNCDTGTVFSWNPCDLKVEVCVAPVKAGEPTPAANSSAWLCSTTQTLVREDASAGSQLDGTGNKDVFNFLDCFKDDPCQFRIPGLRATAADRLASKWTIADFDDDKGLSGDGDDLLIKDWVIGPVPATTAGDADLAPHFQQCQADPAQDGSRFCDSLKLFFNVIPDQPGSVGDDAVLKADLGPSVNATLDDSLPIVNGTSDDPLPGSSNATVVEVLNEGLIPANGTLASDAGIKAEGEASAVEKKDKPGKRMPAKKLPAKADLEMDAATGEAIARKQAKHILTPQQRKKQLERRRLSKLRKMKQDQKKLIKEAKQIEELEKVEQEAEQAGGIPEKA